MPPRTIWAEDGRVFLIDQTLLPGERRILEIGTSAEMWEAIRLLRVRGAPAIGIAAAYGVWVAVRDCVGEGDAVLRCAEEACDHLATSRPTAVNLFWALDRVRHAARANAGLDADGQRRAILDLANRMVDEDNAVCLAIGRHGAALLADGARVLTHCNAGGLATAQYGTALAVVYYAAEREGKRVEVFADETRPLLQGARLTAWELREAGIPVTLICDNMAASVMRRGWVDAVIVGTDRVVRNGDFANKIGTYGLAICAREHGVPLYVAAPLSSIDVQLATGDEIPIEERDPAEVTAVGGVTTAPDGIRVFNPAFDVTPHRLVTAFITEKGVIRPPYHSAIPDLFD
jgi:methylthioribose-1-phosphate isomerase